MIGLVAVGLGGIGIIVPGLPSTVFFIAAAWCFARSNARLERWLLGLPMVGPLVDDYRSGRGMPHRAKVTAVTMIALFCSISAWRVPSWWLATIIVILGLVGIAWIVWRVPTHRGND